MFIDKVHTMYKKPSKLFQEHRLDNATSLEDVVSSYTRYRQQVKTAKQDVTANKKPRKSKPIRGLADAYPSKNWKV